MKLYTLNFTKVCRLRTMGIRTNLRFSKSWIAHTLALGEVDCQTQCLFKRSTDKGFLKADADFFRSWADDADMQRRFFPIWYLARFFKINIWGGTQKKPEVGHKILLIITSYDFWPSDVATGKCPRRSGHRSLLSCTAPVLYPRDRQHLSCTLVIYVSLTYTLSYKSDLNVVQ